MPYLCYDIRGIQDFIFRVPRLASIIGGSALVDQFDHDAQKDLTAADVEPIFAGGGRGAFRVEGDSAADRLQVELMTRAHEKGMDVRFGRSQNYSEASHCADQLFAYLPQGNELTGWPCAATGSLPVVGQGNMHRTAILRHQRGPGSLGRHFEQRLVENAPRDIPAVDFGPEMHDDSWNFFHCIDEADDIDKTGAAQAAYRALGGNGRFAVICMDGNDIGSQFRTASNRLDVEKLQDWTCRVGASLSKATLAAVRSGIGCVVREWAHGYGGELEHFFADGQLILPLRPLLVGGDDVVVLCRADLAMAFVEATSNCFTDQSAKEAESAVERGIPELWPATGNYLTISAGVLFCSDRLPLHAAIQYAEQLLASAKGCGRKLARSGQAAPPCVDYETVTESLLDSPADRRQRLLVFTDGDAHGRVTRLTCRPYLLEEAGDLRNHPVNNLPRSTRHELLRGLRCGLHDRRLLLARLGKRDDAHLLQHLEQMDDGRPAKGDTASWWRLDEDGVVGTNALDAIELAEEMGRLKGDKDGREVPA